MPERAHAAPVPERAQRDEGPAPASLDLRILTPDLTEEEIAAVMSVVAAAIEAERAVNEDRADAERLAGAARWRRSLGPLPASWAARRG